VNRYYNDPSYYLDPSLVRPYRVGMSCGLCHVGPHPLNPPKDVEEPGWENLSATIGNQYLRTRMVFGNLLEPDNYFYHVLDSQLPGALDTSLIPSDNINNANAQNAIFELGGRLDRAGLFLHRTKEYELEYLKRYGTNSKETAATAAISWPVLFDGTKDAYVNPRPVPRVLIDGSDSIGAWTALARVYLNIGTFHQRWVTLHNPVFGFSRSRPFIMEDADLNSTYWQATKALMGDVAKYLLKASTPMKLKDAPGGSSYLKGAGVPWAPELENGRRVFASRCIVCHSSKQPRMFDETPAGSLLTLLSNPDYANWAKDEVKSEEFWRDNYLSSDRRLPVSLVKTNAARSLASNGTAGKLWQEFSSEDYKRLPAVDAISIWNPFTSKAENVNLPGGGRGYYRPPSLVAVWATAPLLHNNSVGRFNNDPSVEGRVLAFRDAIGKLLASGATDEAASTARRALGSDLNGATLNRLEHDRGLIWRLPRTAQLRIPANQLPLFVASACSLPVAFVQQPWIVPAAVFALAGFCLIGGRWLRRLGYLLMFLAFCAGALTSFAAGYLVDVSVPLPAGLPVNVIANLDFERMDDEGTRAAAKRMWRVGKKVRDIWRAPDAAAASTAFNALATELDAIGKNRDHVLDRGHYFGADLTEQERQDLTDLLLTF
jgi:mono/diheme cytochrome c family protein